MTDPTIPPAYRWVFINSLKLGDLETSVWYRRTSEIGIGIHTTHPDDNLRIDGKTINILMKSWLRPCPMCNDKQGMGAPPKPKQPTVSNRSKFQKKIANEIWKLHIMQFLQTTACKQCLSCKSCSAALPLTSKFSVKVIIWFSFRVLSHFLELWCFVGYWCWVGPIQGNIHDVWQGGLVNHFIKFIWLISSWIFLAQCSQIK